MALPALTAEELAIFKRDGLLIKHNALDPQLCRDAVDLIWAHDGHHSHPSTHLRRGDPATYVGPFPEADSIRHGDNGAHVRDGYSWQVRELGSHPVLLDLLPHRVRPWLEQLIGVGTLVDPVPHAPFHHKYWEGDMSRGFYCTLSAPPDEPRTPISEQLGGAHIDTHPAHVTLTALLEEVRPGGGGTLFWPGSFKLYREANPLFADVRRSSLCRTFTTDPTTLSSCLLLPLPCPGASANLAQC